MGKLLEPRIAIAVGWFEPAHRQLLPDHFVAAQRGL
jgi:hypothetical protein